MQDVKKLVQNYDPEATERRPMDQYLFKPPSSC